MIILGIDPGLQKTGWGLISKKGSALGFIASGLITTQSSKALGQRLTHLHQGLCTVIENHNPEYVAVEETFVNRNPASALKLGQARGVLMAVPGLYGLSVAEYSANKIKKSLVGTGHAHKDQMGMMIRTLLPACGKVSADEADALAVAITHAHYKNYDRQINRNT